MTPWYKSPTIWLGIVSILIAMLDGIVQSHIITDAWWGQMILAVIGVLTIARRVMAPPATPEEIAARPIPVEEPKP